MTTILHFSLALIIIVLLALWVSHDRSAIRYRFIVQLLVIEGLVSGFFLHSQTGSLIATVISHFFNRLMSFAAAGTDFVFGGMSQQGLAFVFLSVLCPIIFISALIGILQHWKILPLLIKFLGTLLSRISGMGKLESFNAVSTLVLGQSENFIAYRGILADISSARLYTMAATAMSTVSLSIVGAYMNMLEPRYVVTALILNMLSTFVVLSIINPIAPQSDEEIDLQKMHQPQTFFEMLGDYILAGFRVAVIILAMLIGFIALLAAINALFSLIFGYSFQQLLGYLFYPVAWLLGIPASEALQAGSIMATKLVSNEFVAMIELKQQTAAFTPKGLAILSVFLVSFANFASIGIVAGAIKGLNEHQGNQVSRFGWKLVYGSTLVSLLSAAFTGLFV